MEHPDEGQIHAWLDGALPADEASVLEAHVAACAECSAAVAEARGFVAAASRIVSTLDEVPGGVLPASNTTARASIASVAAVASAPAAAPRAVRAPRAWWARPQLAAAALLVVAVGSVYTFGSGDDVQVAETVVSDQAVSGPSLAPSDAAAAASGAVGTAGSATAPMSAPAEDAARAAKMREGSERSLAATGAPQPTREMSMRAAPAPPPAPVAPQAAAALADGAGAGAGRAAERGRVANSTSAAATPPAASQAEVQTMRREARAAQDASSGTAFAKSATLLPALGCYATTVSGLPSHVRLTDSAATGLPQRAWYVARPFPPTKSDTTWQWTPLDTRVSELRRIARGDTSVFRISTVTTDARGCR